MYFYDGSSVRAERACEGGGPEMLSSPAIVGARGAEGRRRS